LRFGAALRRRKRSFPAGHANEVADGASLAESRHLEPSEFLPLA
jgi:hypothetical protein